MNATFRPVLLAILISGWGMIPALTQTTSVIPVNEAAQHVGQHVTIEGVVAKIFTSRKGNTFRDDVILTTDYGFGKMISNANDETADVWIEQIDESSAISSESIRDAITKSAVVTPSPSVSAATPVQLSLAVATPIGGRTKALCRQQTAVQERVPKAYGTTRSG